MSITYSKPARTGVNNRISVRAIGLVIAIIAAGLFLSWLTALEPLTDADRAEMLIDGTQNLPQDR